MSRKDYVIVASAIREELNQALDQPAISNTLVSALDSLANTLAERMKHDNPAFDRNRFMAACGLN